MGHAADVFSRAVTSRAGRTTTGTWQANVKDEVLETFADMLQRAAKTQILGTWHYGQMSGTWSAIRAQE